MGGRLALPCGGRRRAGMIGSGLAGAKPPDSHVKRDPMHRAGPRGAGAHAPGARGRGACAPKRQRRGLPCFVEGSGERWRCPRGVRMAFRPGDGRFDPGGGMDRDIGRCLRRECNGGWRNERKMVDERAIGAIVVSHGGSLGCLLRCRGNGNVFRARFAAHVDPGNVLGACQPL